MFRMPRVFSPEFEDNLLLRFLVLLRLFFLRLLFFRLDRHGLRMLLLLRSRSCFRLGRRALGLRTLDWWRSQWPLRCLIPVGLRPMVRLSCRRAIRFRLSFRLACGRPIRFRL
jgi:hypothetical protein